MNYTEEIKLLSQLGSEASQAALTEYTRYFVVSSIWWAAVYSAAVGACVWLFLKVSRDKDADADIKLMVFAITGLVGLLCAFGVADNVSDALNPRAMAIHQLITDLRGS